MQEQTIFDLLYPKYKINKSIRLITLFSGYDSQALALKYLGIKFEHWKTCEWAIKSIQALNDLHFQDYNDYSASFNIEQVKEILLNKGISQNYNEPLNEKQIKKMSEKYARNVFNNIMATHNLVNIMQVKGEDLEINNTDKYDYIMTYSFPCQDLSLAGKGKGMSDTSTRSGLLWEVERILTELEEKPQILLMENVPQVHSQDNIEDFKKWILRLEELGYKNYWQDLTATDYGIPQTRNRCFMVSLLGDYSYSFPPKQPLELKLKDMLEDNVPEKYYLSEKLINSFMSNTQMGNITRKDRFLQNINRTNQDTNNSITTLNGQRVTDTFIPQVIGGIGEKKSNGGTQWYLQDRIYNDNVAVSIATCFNPYYKDKYKIRKLTPFECFALMGINKEDYDRVAKNQTDSSLYHLAGDSIVVNVLMAIFKELL